MKDKTRCKKCGQKLPTKYPEFLHGTVILPGIKHAEKSVTMEHLGDGQYRNTECIDFPISETARLEDRLILHAEGIFLLVKCDPWYVRDVQNGDVVSILSCDLFATFA